MGSAKSDNKNVCSVFKQCGGCELLDVPYDEQLQQKRHIIAEMFEHLSPNIEVAPVLGMSNPFYYRNKVATPYAPVASARTSKKRGRAHANGKILTGMYAKGTHKLIPTDECLIENKVGTMVKLAVRSIMQKWHIEPYDEDAGAGFVRHSIVRVGQNSGEVLVTLVTNSEDFPNSKSFARELVKRVPQITTIVQNVNLRQTNVILGEKERTLYGPGFILDTLCGLSFRISSKSFYQVNSSQAEVLYDKAIEMVQLTGAETVLDAYCGTGTIGLVAAKRGAAKVVGVESVASAVEDARMNAKHNGISNAHFVVADATDFAFDVASGAGDVLTREDCRNLVLIMDPPRAGSTEAFLKAAVKLSPKRIVYISCNPKTQVRDVYFLAKRGYRITGIQPIDMFPHTQHIENIVALERL